MIASQSPMRAAWLARPGMKNDPARWLPRGHAASDSDRVAIFFVPPTTALDRDRWNAPLDDHGEIDTRRFRR